MGIYDQLSQLSQTPPVAAPEPVKTVEVVPSQEMEMAKPKPAVKKPTTPRIKPEKPEINPKLPLDIQASRQRIITRASFEIYQDQLHVLRQVSLSAKLAGEQLSISEMVREALDSYLTDKNLK
jgi:hypothetical protein